MDFSRLFKTTFDQFVKGTLDDGRWYEVSISYNTWVATEFSQVACIHPDELRLVVESGIHPPEPRDMAPRIAASARRFHAAQPDAANRNHSSGKTGIMVRRG